MLLTFLMSQACVMLIGSFTLILLCIQMAGCDFFSLGRLNKLSWIFNQNREDPMIFASKLWEAYEFITAII